VALRADLAVFAEIRKLFLEVGNELGRLDLLVNSAANFFAGKCDFDHRRDLGRIAGHECESAVFLCAGSGTMLRRSKGSIVNFADTGGLLGWPG